MREGWSDVLLFEQGGQFGIGFPSAAKWLEQVQRQCLFLLRVTLAVRQKNLLVQNGSTWSYCPLSVRFPSLCPLCLSALVHWWNLGKKMELETWLEHATCALRMRCSTNWAIPAKCYQIFLGAVHSNKYIIACFLDLSRGFQKNIWKLHFAVEI